MLLNLAEMRMVSHAATLRNHWWFASKKGLKQLETTKKEAQSSRVWGAVGS